MLAGRNPQRQYERVEHRRRREENQRPFEQVAVGLSRKPRQREAKQRIEHQDVAGPDENGVNRADRQQNPQTSLEPRQRRVTAPRQLDPESNAEQQRKDRVELLVDEYVLEPDCGAIRGSRRERGNLISRKERQSEKDDD